MRTRWTRLFAKVVLAVVLVVGIFALSGVVSGGRLLPTAFAADCYTSGLTLETDNIRDIHNNILGTVELRWSAPCGTNWSRVTTTHTADEICARVQRDDGAKSADYCVTGNLGPGFQIFSDSLACASNRCQAYGFIRPASGQGLLAASQLTGWH